MNQFELDEKSIQIVLDGRTIAARPGELIIQAAERAGVFIPRFCYHPRMSSVGVCRMCLVEVKGPRGFSLQPSCFLSVTPEMEVITNSDKVKKAQDGVLEFLLVNHPLDCPVCDKGGECPLQDQVLAYGPGESRFVEEKRHFEKPIALSELVFLDRERCIQCDRCTRFASEIALDPLIDFMGRSDQLEINIFPDKPFASYFSGNTVQICPVGALTAKPYRFKARPWDISQTESTCTTCSVGCRIAVQFSRGELTRYIGLDSDAVNHSWLCDKGRFGHEAVNSEQRVVSPLSRFGTELVKVGWRDALGIVAALYRRMLAENGPESIGFIGGAKFTNEGLYSWVRLAKEFTLTDNFDASLGHGFSPEIVFGLPRASINEAMAAKVIVVAMGDVREELPVLFLRLVAAKKAGTKIVEVSPIDTSISTISDFRVEMNSVEFLTALISNDDQLDTFKSFVIKNTNEEGLDLACLIAPSDVAINSSISDSVAFNLAKLWPRSKFVLGMTNGNIFGAYDMGAIPGFAPGRIGMANLAGGVSTGLGTHEMLERAISNNMLLFVLAEDLLLKVSDTALVEKALNAATVVVVDSYESKVFRYADVVLPVAVFAEAAGTTTNLEGRVSRLGQALVPMGSAKADYVIAAELSRELIYPGLDVDPEVIFNTIASNVGIYHGLGYSELASPRSPDGIVIPLPRTKVVLQSHARRLDPIATPGIVAPDRQGPPTSEIAQATRATQLNGLIVEDKVVLDDPTSREVTLEPLMSFNGSEIISKNTLRTQNMASKRLVVSQRLYSPDPVLSSTTTLRVLQTHAKVLLSEETMQVMGIDDGAFVVLKSDDGSIAKAAAFKDLTIADYLVVGIPGIEENFLTVIKHDNHETFVELGVE